MSDRILDMRAQLENAKPVSRELQGLAADTKKVEDAAGGAATGTISLSKALNSGNEAATNAIKSTEKLFSATDALAGVVGKALGVVGLVNLAWDVGVAIYERAAGAQIELGDAVDYATGKVKAQQAELQGIIDASERLATASGLLNAEFSAEERLQIQAREQQRIQTKRELLTVMAEEERLQLRVDFARRSGGVSALEGDLERTKAERERLAFTLRGLDEVDKALAASVRKREGLDTKAPRAKGPNVLGMVDRLLADARANPIDLDAILGADLEPEIGDLNAALADLFDPENVRQATAFAAGLSTVAAQLQALAAEDRSVAEALALDDITVEATAAEQALAGLDGEMRAFAATQRAISAARREGTRVTLQYAEAEGKAAAAAALSAALRGESVAAAVNAVLQGVAVEATVQAAFEFAKGLAASSNPITAAEAAGHFAAAKAFGVTAAIAGAGALATGGFGAAAGGPAPPSPADVSAPGGPGGEGSFGRDRAAAGAGYTIINNLDLRSRPWATNRELQRELVRQQNDFARVPGREKLNVGRLGGRGGGY